jgi:hypothetical protein
MAAVVNQVNVSALQVRDRIGDDTHGVVTVLLAKSKHGAVALMPLAKQGTIVLMNRFGSKDQANSAWDAVTGTPELLGMGPCTSRQGEKG